ncbi:MAG: DEAD/DEAH box helicase [Treponema sp.]|nr:DEAD/DEAH box helicase [Treponema sp.]
MNYSELPLNENLKKGLEEAGYVTCTPVQEKVLEASLDGSDLYVQSQTGTGKTAAFLVSIMQELLSRGEGEKSNALILVPTRELAVQVEEEAKKLGKYTGLSFAAFFGGVGYEKQIADLKNGIDIIIGTPGRVIDLQESRHMDLSRVAHLVTDEADRMFDMGFYPDLRKLIKVLPSSENRQTMLFSATLNMNVKNLAYEYTKDPKEITIEAQNITVDEIDQELIHVSSEKKLNLLLSILAKENPESLIIFCNTKKTCEILSKRLALNGIQSEFIIGDLPQKKRQKIMDNFKAGKIRILVATDVAARGIDVNDLAMVVNYDLPNEAENYVHRIGRTARAGKSGKAYTFCSEQDVYSLMPIERYIEKSIPSRVAIDEDYAEDKSDGIYIRLDGDEDRDRHGRRGERRILSRDRERDGGRRERKSSKKSPRREAVGTGRTSDEEIEKLASMTSDERLAYFKSKYAKNGAAEADSTQKRKRKPKSQKKRSAESGGKKPSRQMQSQQRKATNKNISRNPQKGTKRAEAKSSKRIGLIGKIRAFFSKK